MDRSQRNRNLIANLLIAAGVVLLLGAAGYCGWQAYRGQQARAYLQQTPAAVVQKPAVALPVVTPTDLPPTAPLSPTIPPAPTATRSSLPTTAAVTASPSPEPARPQPTTTPTPAPTLTAPPAVTAVADGPPAHIVIPDLKIDARVVEMGWRAVDTPTGPQSEWDLDAIRNAVGHHLNSALLGETGNVVISGHNNIYGREFEPISLAWPNEPAAVQRLDDFTDRTDILNGRDVQLYNAAGQRFDYRITEFYRLKDTGVPIAQRIANGRFMQPTDDARLTLVTCWPIWSNTHRLVVVAKPVNQP
jgi:sortase A